MKTKVIGITAGASIVVYQMFLVADRMNLPWYSSAECFNQFHPQIALFIAGFSLAIMSGISLSL